MVDQGAALIPRRDLTVEDAWFVAGCRMRAAAAWAVRHVTKAIDILLYAHGATGFAESGPLQRIRRDSAVAARHAIILPTVNLEVYGKALLRVLGRIS